MEHYTINDFNNQFPNDDACLEWLRNYLYPDGITCKSCGRITNHSKLSNLPVYSCNRCGAHTHPMSGTIFERSRTPLKNWFYAIFLMSATRSGISAKQLQRELGVTYKTAWRMFREIRTLMQSSPQPMLGIVEADECYIGGRSHGKRGRASENKTPVFGLVQRGGNVHSEKVERVTARNLKAIIRERVDRSSIMVTDEFWSYNYLHEEFAGHLRVNHSKGEYANGIVHTNTIEGFWSVLKRGINGVYHAVSKKYLQSYIDEYAFRYNHRKDEQPMFLTILAKV